MLFLKVLEKINLLLIVNTPRTLAHTKNPKGRLVNFSIHDEVASIRKEFPLAYLSLHNGNGECFKLKFVHSERESKCYTNPSGF